MQDGCVEPGRTRELGVGVERVAIPAQAVQQCLLRQCGHVGDVVGLALGRRYAAGLTAMAAETALAAREEPVAG